MQVGDAAYPLTSVNDTGLATGTEYSYALFAHNTDPLYASAVNLTATTTAAGTGAVAGLVTDGAGSHHGLAGVHVSVYSPTSGGPYTVLSAADGGYTVPGLTPAGDYQVCFQASGATGGSSDAPGYIDQCWQNQATSGTSTPVAVTSVATRTGINAALAPAGAISGTVTDAGGSHQPLAQVVVAVSALPTGAPVQVTTGPDGTYTVPRLPAGTAYQVCFQGSGPPAGPPTRPGISTSAGTTSRHRGRQHRCT